MSCGYIRFLPKWGYWVFNVVWHKIPGVNGVSALYLCCLLLGGWLWLANSTAAAQASDKLRDPTRPLMQMAEEKNAPSLHLHSILIGDTRRGAIINGRFVKENDRIHGVEVMNILPGKVVVRQNGMKKSLILHRSVKKLSSG